MTKFLAIAILALGCSAAGADGSNFQAPLVLSPSPEIEPATREAMQAWQAATGIEIQIGAGGVPVSIEDSIQDCGLTFTDRAGTGELRGVHSIVVRRDAGRRCANWSRTLRHEIGHALMNHFSPDVGPGLGHAEAGIMADRANATPGLDQAALELVCAIAPCAWMSPEVSL